MIHDNLLLNGAFGKYKEGLYLLISDNAINWQEPKLIISRHSSLPNECCCFDSQPCFFYNDSEVLSFITSQTQDFAVVLSSKLFHSSIGTDLISQLEALSIDSFMLDESIAHFSNNFILLGLEQQWTSDEALDRIHLNNLRLISSVIHICFVSFRGVSSCCPSLIAGDY